MRDSQDVFDGHMKAVSTLNAEQVIEDYAVNALLIAPDRTYQGRNEILDFYKNLLPTFQDFEFTTIKQETHANLVYFVWRGQNKHVSIKLATDTYIIESGKIKQHTFAAINN